jgi:ribosomal protein S18 acetylase RimI-like enzyme
MGGPFDSGHCGPRCRLASVPGPTIRAAAPDDAGEVEQLRVAGWQTAYRGIVPDAFLDSMRVDAEHRRHLIAGRAAADFSVESVAVQSGAIVGWVVGHPCRDADRTGPRHGEIHACYVLPEWWGNGVGRLLLSHATAALGEYGMDDITLWVLEANHRARRFYEACGFRPDGKRQFLNMGQPVPEVRYQVGPGSQRLGRMSLTVCA